MILKPMHGFRHSLVRLTMFGLAIGGGVGVMGCSPLRVSFDVGFAPSPELVERTVHDDVDAGKSHNKIAMISVTGLLADVKQPGFFGGGTNPVDELVRRLELAERDDQVRAVILRINSPGGTVTGSDIMHREVRDFTNRTHKPVVASLGEVAASGGYYLALAADEIIAEPTSVTGSIGVIMQTVNFSGGLAKLGIEARAVTSGPNKDMGNALEPIRENHYTLMQAMVDEYYTRFLRLVRERRPGLSDDDVTWATDGRVVTGMEAQRISLVDTVGGVRDAFTAAKERAGIERARLIAYTGQNDQPASPYGVSNENDPAARGRNSSGGTALRAVSSRGGEAINLFQFNMTMDRSLLTPGAGFYYLWSPAP